MWRESLQLQELGKMKNGRKKKHFRANTLFTQTSAEEQSNLKNTDSRAGSLVQLLQQEKKKIETPH